MEKLIALHRNHSGSIISFETSEGRIISYKKAIQEAEEGILAGVQRAEDAEGNIFLLPEMHQSFDQMPEIY
ncbi:DUF3892 domain-containing protein [Neobacillus sp. PS3-34]|uniref:DUF3892 domain-containing protein n=1 Tax=Neobacillus sp. PS3-34 TaxID=3070678 RepID=UPI0027E0AF06|nr:DUF3892 domain-containing protein [Neobacillus sp. PS3-34]WML47767.1 DUF3892 domain-containing protein [Neobacillus sp. PS3-34]